MSRGSQQTAEPYTTSVRRSQPGALFPFMSILLILASCVHIAVAGQTVTRAWYRIEVVRLGLGLPSHVSGSFLGAGIGLPPPLGLGIGFSAVEMPSLGADEDAYAFFPASLYYCPFANEKTSVYFAISSSPWLSGYAYWKAKVGVIGRVWHDWFPMDLECGFYSQKYPNYPEPTVLSSAYIELGFTAAGRWGLLTRMVGIPKLAISAEYRDADGNHLLSGGEQASLALVISNTGDGAARDVLVTARLNDDLGGRLKITQVGGLGNIGPYDSREAALPIVTIGDLPRGSCTVDIMCNYKTGSGEERETGVSVTVNAAPPSGMVKVSFRGVPPQGLPDWIVPTALEHADYEASYSGGSATILNLNTGDRLTRHEPSAAMAQQYVKQFFLGWDKADPQITLSSSGGTVNTDAVKLKVRFSDDRKLDGMKLYLNGKEHDDEQFSERTETERDFTLPLLMGDNTVRLTVADWVGKTAEKSIGFTRIRGGVGTYETGPLPEGEAPPSLAIEAAPLDGNNTVVGGREEGVKAAVTNRGKGVAKWVRVTLEGDEYLTRQWGSERNLEDIKPGESKTATFSLLMPTDIERRQAKLRVVVKEGRGYAPTEVPELTLSLVPAEKTSTQVEVVEDVDNDVPRTVVSRSDGYALVVGLSQYQSVPAPKYGRKDAEAFAKYVSGPFGISQLRTMYDERATIGTIRANLTDWLKKKHGFKVIYFAGHGVPDPENPRSGGVCVLPYDGDPELKSTLIPVSDLAELGANDDDTVVVFIDACYSGEGRTVELASRPLVIAEVPETKAITFAAAEGNQPSKEFEKAQHGYFTYYTLLGLKGKADANNDGWVTTTELYNYVKKNVSDATNEVQVPVLRPERDIKLGRVR